MDDDVAIDPGRERHRGGLVGGQVYMRMWRVSCCYEFEECPCKCVSGQWRWGVGGRVIYLVFSLILFPSSSPLALVNSRIAVILGVGLV